MDYSPLTSIQLVFPKGAWLPGVHWVSSANYISQQGPELLETPSNITTYRQQYGYKPVCIHGYPNNL